MADATYDVYVDYSGLDSFSFSTTGLDESLSKADAAGLKAIEAVGGENTPAGAAMKEALVPINKAYFEQTKAELASLEQDLKKLASEYKDASTQLAANIRSISEGGSNG